MALVYTDHNTYKFVYFLFQLIIFHNHFKDLLISTFIALSILNFKFINNHIKKLNRFINVANEALFLNLFIIAD
jgi:hypothetical protein